MNENEIAVELKDVNIKFNLGKEKVDSLKDFVIKFFTRKLKYDEFWALKDISFKINKGDRVGILGLNGAGKSTLLKVIAQVYEPTTGSVYRKGVIAPLLELGAGFDNEYTAKENVYLYGAVLGYSKSFIKEKYDEIISFAELEQFADVPLKNFSSGMRSRLGFSVCTAINPDILILDEVLAVGDAKFKAKCEQRLQKMFDSKITVLFVSHSIDQVKRICNKAMILDKGRLVAFGEIGEVAEKYDAMVR